MADFRNLQLLCKYTQSEAEHRNMPELASFGFIPRVSVPRPYIPRSVQYLLQSLEKNYNENINVPDLSPSMGMPYHSTTYASRKLKTILRDPFHAFPEIL